MISSINDLALLLYRLNSKEIINQLNNLDVKSIINEIIIDKLAISKIANNSFLHPNGFYKIVIYEGIKGERIRIHFWSEKSKNIIYNKSDIHDHFWEFISLVLFGNLHSEIFIPTNDLSESYFQHFILQDTSNQSYKLERIGKSKLLCTQSKILKKGDIYSLKESQLHRVNSMNNTATLVLQGNRKQKENHVYTSQIKKATSDIVNLRKLTISEVTNILKIIKTYL